MFSVQLGLDKANSQIIFSHPNQDSFPSGYNQWILTNLAKPEALGKSSFRLDAYYFLKSLRSFSEMRTQAGLFELEIRDDFVKNLINKFIAESSDVEAFRLNPHESLSQDKMLSDLISAGFLRANSLTQDQLRDIGRMAFLGNGANFSVPGAGKTTALLAVHSLALRNKTVDRLLVVAPRNALGAWDKEVKACLGSVQIARLTGGVAKIRGILNQNPTIASISYQQLRISHSELLPFLRNSRVHLVLDEAHRAKGGEKSQQGEAALLLAPFAARRDILTGTPMPQGINDVKAQMSFLWPGQTIFDQDWDLSDNVSRAKVNLKPFYVRTRKSELNLPPINFKYHAISMGTSQKELYKFFTNKLTSLLSDFDPEQEWKFRKMGSHLMKNLMFCADPDVFLESLDSEDEYKSLLDAAKALTQEESQKLAKLDELVEEILIRDNEKIVIWSSFTNVIEKLAGRYEDIHAMFIHGGVDTDEDGQVGSREWVVNRFHEDPSSRILIANPAACGEGISLHHAAHNAIYFDRTFNAAHFMQSVDRIHRRGLPPEVNTQVHVLYCLGTVEEVVLGRLSQKVKALEQLLEDPDLVSMVYDPEDVLEQDQTSIGLDLGDIEALQKFLHRSAKR